MSSLPPSNPKNTVPVPQAGAPFKLKKNPKAKLERYRELFRRLQAESARNRLRLYFLYRNLIQRSESPQHVPVRGRRRGTSGKVRPTGDEWQQALLKSRGVETASGLWPGQEHLTVAELQKRHQIRDVSDFWSRATLVPCADEFLWEPPQRYGQPLDRIAQELLGAKALELDHRAIEFGIPGVLTHACPAGNISEAAPHRGTTGGIGLLEAPKPCVALTGFLRPAGHGMWESCLQAKGAERICVSVSVDAKKGQLVIELDELLAKARKAIGVGAPPPHVGKEPLIENPDLFAAMWIMRAERGTPVADLWRAVVPGAPSILEPARLKRCLDDFEQHFVKASKYYEGLDAVAVADASVAIVSRAAPVNSPSSLLKEVCSRLQVPPREEIPGGCSGDGFLETIRLCTLFIGAPRWATRSWEDLILCQEPETVQTFLPWMGEQEVFLDEADFVARMRRLFPFARRFRVNAVELYAVCRKLGLGTPGRIKNVLHWESGTARRGWEQAKQIAAMACKGWPKIDSQSSDQLLSLLLEDPTCEKRIGQMRPRKGGGRVFEVQSRVRQLRKQPGASV